MKLEVISGDFDFAAWARLACSDPAGFEAARRKAIERIIANGNEEQLNRLQWRLDAERRRARTPLKACIQMSALMWTTFDDLHTYITCLKDQRDVAAASKPAQSARILPFRRPLIS